jgi:uncharacterized protein (TIGR00255 family)
MLVSMTGFGQGEASNRHGRVSVEIRSVNHRYLDLSIKMPRNLSHREHEIKDLLKNKIQRGRISITVTAEAERPAYGVEINVPLMEQYVAQLQGFAKRHSLSDSVNVNTLASLPEVFHLKERSQTDDELWPLVKKSLKQAVTTCNTMRAQEGKALEADLRTRITIINRLIKKIESRAPKVVARHSAALKERLDKILGGKARVDKDRWMTEVAILADRLDFTEEVIRLKSHMVQILACLDKGGAVAKKLTYLLQEVHREATTIASKASDAEVVEYMVGLKEESERLREQVQNLE